MAFILRVLFGCPHYNLSRVWGHPEKGCHRICLDCGSQFKYDWDNMRMVK